MAISIRSYNQILGDMIRKIIANTPVNDVNTGSVILTLLEAAATNDFENNTAILNVLELLNIDVLKNNDLDARAADFSLKRKSAVKTSGQVKISDSNITKISTSLYPVKPAPIASATKLFVNNAADWAPTGTLYIGRGTSSFEGPIPYTSIVNSGTFYTINLGSSLQKDHLISDSVVDAQGTTDRLIPAGTIVSIPANNQSAEIRYSTLRDAVIPAGEDSVTGVEVQALVAGSAANAGINTIVNFASPPFSGATVTNTTAFTNGADVESDESLRERIKSYAQTLARGTSSAILGGIVGISDPDDSKQVASAVITEPVSLGEPAIVYIDDGSGFQPSYQGQSVDVLLNEATGKEEFLQLANFPIPRPQVVNVADGPYQLIDGMQLRVLVDDDEEIVTFSVSDFSNISAATLPELVVAINNQATIFKVRLDQNSTRLLLYPTDFSAETIQVGPLRSTDLAAFYANSILKFPTNQFSYINLFQNSTRLREKQKAANLTTAPFSTWNVTSASNIVISVDGTPQQDRTFDTVDFGGSAFTALTLNDWVTVFNRKFAGLNAVATSGGSMRITSNKVGSGSAIDVLGGDLLDKWFPNLETSSVGQDPQFELNRQNGNLRILGDIEVDDTIAAGTDDAKGNLQSLPTISGTYNVSTDAASRPAEMVVVVDATKVQTRPVTLTIGSTITISDQGSSVMRIMSSSSSAFISVQPLDYVYITNRGDIDGSGTGSWIDIASCGLYKVIRKGNHTVDGVNSYIEVQNDDIVVGSYTVQAGEDIQAFYSDKYPQIWRGAETATPAADPIEDMVDSLNEQLAGVIASVFKTNRIKLTSATELGGSIAIPVSVGNAKQVFEGAETQQAGNPPLIANVKNNKDIISYFKRTTPTNTNVFLDRYAYTDLKSSLTANAVPGTEGVDPYSEILEAPILNTSNVSPNDLVQITKGNNKQVYRSIKQILGGNQIGTQFSKPDTVMDHIVGDNVEVLRPVQISSEDSIVMIVDKDAVAKTIDIPMSRTGRVNAGSQSMSFLPTSTSFSADDADNEPGVDFGTPQVWSKTLNHTDFSDYATWFRARNFYSSGGVGAGDGVMLLRAFQYGPTGEKIRFSTEYPEVADATALTQLLNGPEFTQFQYFFGSGGARTTNIVSGSTFQVSSLGGDDYRYTWSVGVDLSTVQIGDIFSALRDSGISEFNRGQQRITAVNAGARTFDIYNPDAAITSPGNPEVVDITTVADIPGTPAINTVQTLPESSGIDGTYFVLYDTAGSVGVWYDVNNAGNPPPTTGTDRLIKIPTILTGDTADQVASKTAIYLNLDAAFSATVLTDTITVTNNINGMLPAATAGTSGFTMNQLDTGSDPDSLNTKYFIMYDDNGSIAFWFDIDAQGSQEPIHGANRAVRITSVNSGDSANTVAGKLSAAINADGAYTATFALNVVTATDTVSAPRTAANAGTSGFTVVVTTPGAAGTPETVIIPTSVAIYPLTGTAVSDIVATINETDIIKAVAVGSPSLTIEKRTRDEVYTPAGPNDYSLSLAYGHDPNPINGFNTYVGLYDSVSWVQLFENSNPNFTLKKPLVLVGVAPSVYAMNTAPNDDTALLGEAFKLIPITVKNVEHHFTQKALSQLPIIAGVDISDNNRRIQAKSKLLGSNGAIEIVGGRANTAQFYVAGDSQEISSGGNNYLEVKIPAFPDTLNVGDLVKLQNDAGVKRLSRLGENDTLDVIKISNTIFEYRYNPKETFFGPYVAFTISDVSGSYGRPAGFVWRWQHSDAGSYAAIQSKTNGTVLVQPQDEVASGGGVDSPRLHEEVSDPGTISSPLTFRLTASTLPFQADYFTFRNPANTTYAVWFDIDSAGVPPTGASYLAATNQIMVSILSTDTPNQVVNKLAAALTADSNFITDFDISQTSGATLEDVNPGDLIYAFGALTGWSSGNKVGEAGDETITGLPIIAVNANSRYVDVVNPDGRAMSSTQIGIGNTVQITPTPIIRWNLDHAARVEIAQIIVSSGTATATTVGAHKLNVGDTFDIKNNTVVPSTPGGGIGTVVTVPAFNQITFATATSDGTYTGGTLLNSSKQVTRYRIENLSFNNMFRLSRLDGESPRFFDSGVAVDDYLVIRGSTFKNNNTGRFRILAVDNDSVIYINENAQEELNTVVPFNNLGLSVNWSNNSALLTGIAGAFENLAVGQWVKKSEDDDSLYRQVISFNTGFANTATIVTLGAIYEGSTDSTSGVRFDQLNDVDKGVLLKSVDDIIIYEGDGVISGDSMFAQTIINPAWFSLVNSGTFDVRVVGVSNDYKPFLRIENPVGVQQLGVQMQVAPSGFYITEAASNSFTTVKQVANIAINQFDDTQRIVHLVTADRAYKFSESNRSSLVALGKLGYTVGITTGVDGYLYYTGLLRTVQRVIDGFEPDPENYPGRKAVGAEIELLPPLIRRTAISVKVTTAEGVNLSEISNEIKSTAIDYIASLGVGEDVILSEIIRRIMGIKGIAAVTFINPTPSTERVFISSNEKAFAEASDISIA